MAKVMTMMRSVSMPISLAVSGSCAVARIALPVFEVRTNAWSPTISPTAATTTKTETQAIVTPPMTKVPFETMRGKGWATRPFG